MSSARKAASRYTSFDTQSSPSSSIELIKPTSKPIPPQVFSRSTKPNTNAITKVKNEQNFTAMVKKFMEKRSSNSTITTWKRSANNGGDRPLPLYVPADFIADDFKKTAKKGSTLAALPKKLFGKGSGSSSNEKKTKALMEVKANTRTLAMVLRSERELLSLNKDQESQIADLTSLLEDRNREVEKLKDLCLKQREEIKALKSALLFPDEMNSQLHDLLERQGSELKQAKQVIPSLQKQISSLTGQLQCLSEDLAEVKAVKYTAKPCSDGKFSSPRTPMYSLEEAAANSLDFSSDDDLTTPDSPDDMLLKDMNPCLTPCYSRMKSKEYIATGYDCADNEVAYERNKVNSGSRKLSRSSDQFSNSRDSTSGAHVAFRRSDESKCRYRKRIDHKVL